MDASLARSSRRRLPGRPIPRWALLGAAAMVGLAFLSAVLGRFGEVGVLHAPTLAPIAERTVRFEDREAAGLVVTDVRATEAGVIEIEDGAAADGRVSVVATEDAGFLRGVLRGLARDRRMRGVDLGAPYRIELARDGGGMERLTIIDTVTERRLPLDGFGGDNFRAFRDLVAPGAGAGRAGS